MKNKILYLMLLFIIIYLLLYNFLNSLFGSNIYNMFINPIFWLIISFICYNFYKRKKINNIQSKDIVQTVLISSIGYLIIYFLFGIIFGYSYSPYKHDLLSIILNIWRICLIIPMCEYVRFVLIKSCKKDKLGYFLITIVLSFTMINLEIFQNSFISFNNTFEYFFGVLFPNILCSFLLSSIVEKASYIPAIIYRLIISITIILVPILPNINWFISSIINMIIVLLTYLYIDYQNLKFNNILSRRKLRKDNPIKIVPFYFLIVLFVLFVIGVFKYQPITIISNSMVPTFSRGDIVIVEKNMDITKLKEGDIIAFGYNNRIITHRIVKIHMNGNKHYFKTKGDNNISVDSYIVSEDNIFGKIIFSIPYLGYPTVWLSEMVK